MDEGGKMFRKRCDIMLNQIYRSMQCHTKKKRIGTQQTNSMDARIVVCWLPELHCSQCYTKRRYGWAGITQDLFL